jgi:hypothetical protein
MSIVFGWNHFRIKSIDPYAAGLSQNAQPGYLIEVRQRYFHLFWIPCFSLGKKWALRKDGELYEMPEPYKFVLQERKDLAAKTPWYTYAGPLLAALVGVCFYVSGKVDDYHSEKRAERQYSAAYADNLVKFRKPTVDDYYVLDPVDGYSDKFARITGLDKNNIQLSYIENASYAYSPADIAKLFVDPGSKMNTITISRGDSAKLICPDYNNRLSFDGISLPGERSKYRLDRIIRLDGPIIKDGGYSSFGQNLLHTKLKNEGLAGDLINIEKVEGDVAWSSQDPLPINLKPNQEFTLIGKGDHKKPFALKLHFRTEDGRAISYLITGANTEKNFQRL